MRNGGGAGLITVRQVPATAARESNLYASTYGLTPGEGALSVVVATKDGANIS